MYMYNNVHNFLYIENRPQICIIIGYYNYSNIVYALPSVSWGVHNPLFTELVVTSSLAVKSTLLAGKVVDYVLYKW